MRNRMIKAGCAVPSVRVGDTAYNTDEIIRLMKENCSCGILVFPELSVTGYTCADLFGQDALLTAAEESLLKIAEASAVLKGLTTAVGFPLCFENNLYNCAALITEGRIAGIVPKTCIPNYGEFYEARWFTPGKSVIGRTVMIGGEEIPFGIDLLFEDEYTGAVIGAEICEDLWVPDKPSTHLALAGADIIVNLSASDELIGKESFRRDMVKMQSAGCYCGYMYVSSCTGESSTDLVFSGHALIAENGTLLEESIFEEKTITAVIDVEKIRYNRRHQTTFASDDASWYRKVPVSVQPLCGKLDISTDELCTAMKDNGVYVGRNPFVPADDAERINRCRRILQIQANGLATRVRATGIHTLVIGISGGLDSTLALLVCHEARKLVPDIRIIGYTMPNRGNTSDLTYTNALNLMKAIDIEIREVPIEKTVEMHLRDIGHENRYLGESDTAYENAQARMRTYILMDAANMENGLVVGTGDLSELALGWCTYNGDHMSMYGVNASIPKTLVQYICRVYADFCGRQELHDTLLAILDTPISPELTPSNNGQIAQKTEDKIGKYDLNDFFMFYLMRYGFAPDKILAFAMYAYPELDKEFIRQAEQRFLKRFFQQQFKRSCLPDGPKVGSVTLSPRGDWRMPSDASVSLWLKNLENA